MSFMAYLKFYRYELHHWLFALHNAMEEYKNTTVQRKKKQGRQRTNSTTTGATPNKTPPKIKPSRPAPPAPKVHDINMICSTSIIYILCIG